MDPSTTLAGHAVAWPHNDIGLYGADEREAEMTGSERPQIYLITPPAFDSLIFADRVSAVLDSMEVACLRLSLSSDDESQVQRACDALREVAHSRDVPLVIDTHIQMVRRAGLDGVHLATGSRSVRSARGALGPDAIVGAFCSASRHDGMTAADAGADYVSFGPAATTSLGDGTHAEHDLFAWWSEMIEVPVVAEGALDAAHIAALAPVTDFFGIGPEIWGHDDPAKAIIELTHAIA